MSNNTYVQVTPTTFTQAQRIAAMVHQLEPAQLEPARLFASMNLDDLDAIEAHVRALVNGPAGEAITESEPFQNWTEACHDVDFFANEHRTGIIQAVAREEASLLELYKFSLERVRAGGE